MLDYISIAITLTMLMACASSQQNPPNDVVLSGRVRINGINIAFHYGDQQEQENLLSIFEDDICNYVSAYGSTAYEWEFQCFVETFYPDTSHVTTKLITPRDVWVSSGMPLDNSFVEAYVGVSLSHFAPSNAVTTYAVSMPNTLVILLCTALPITVESRNQIRTPFERSNQTYLELQADFCSVIESHRANDRIFRNVEVECGVISMSSTWKIVELFLMINNNELELAEISGDKDSIYLAIQNTFGDAVFRHKGVTYAWQIIDPPSGKVPTYFLLRGRILRNGQPVQFNSEQHAATSHDLHDSVEQICSIMKSHGSLAAIYQDRTFECEFKRYNAETSDVTIFVTIRGFDHETINQLQEALSLSQISVQDGDIHYNAQIINRENLQPHVSAPLHLYQVTMIYSTLNEFHYDMRTKEDVIDAFRRINAHVCNHIRPQLSQFPNAQCKVSSFDPVIREFEAYIAIPLDELERSGMALCDININLTDL